ncbi:MAG TPA: baseplate J/gp47 family protein, partial [Myxococcus sp.]|nr:baseplate J/gp47 family protein [Myxococcus sp.]
PVPIEWSYLSGDRWLTLHDGHLLSDTTRHLTDSGIVQLALEPAQPSTRLPGEFYWLRAAIPYRAGGVCDTVGIHAQAVSATFVDGGSPSEHLARKLPERSITGLVQHLASIAAVEQPYPSRGGRPAEAQGGFYTRVSERLRHKQRALTLWDYERLVLERFPELYKVKGLSANAETPGTVELIVIPGARGQLLSNPFEPKAPAALNAEIEAYLSDKRPPQATLRVRNAHFVQVKVRVGVRFRGEGDEGFYKTLLNEDLNRYLSPWAYDEGADITIGGKIFANSIVSFIDGRDYVDYVAAIELFSSKDGRTFRLAPVPVPKPGEPSEGYFVDAGGPDVVLVAARQHEIDVISEVGYTAESFTGINYMKVELDFIVAGSK